MKKHQPSRGSFLKLPSLRNKKNSSRLKKRRACQFEQLEARRVMAAAVWNNVGYPVNVDGDQGGVVSPLDALLVINEINSPRYSDSVTGELPKQLSDDSPGIFFDVSCDNFVSPIDALQVINHINQGGDAGTNGTGVYPNAACSPQLVEGAEFSQEFSHELSLPDDSSAVRIHFQAPEFDTSSQNSIRDAFEIELTDSSGNPVSFPFVPNRDAVYNWSELLEPQFGVGAETTTSMTPGEDSTLTVNLSGMEAGSTIQVSARLVNNDSDDSTSVILRGFEVIDSTVAAPAGAAGASSRLPTLAPLNMDDLEDVSGSLIPNYGHTTLVGDNNELFTALEVTNQGSQAVTGRLIVTVDNITELDAAAMHPDGLLPDGRPYWDLTQEMDGDPLEPGETIRSREIAFLNDSGSRFSYKLSTYGSLNVAPTGFTSTPLTKIEAEDQYVYLAQAEDPDGQQLTYSKVAGPEGMQIDAVTGQVTWTTTSDDIGSHSVLLRATDPHGLYVEQSYSVEVVASLQNRPPIFTSDPVTEAIASSGFEITTVASGAGPAGVAVVNGFRGPGLVTLNDGDQSLSQIDSLGNDLFDLPTRVPVGEPAPDGQVLRGGYSVDVGLPAFEHTGDDNEISGMDQADLNGDGTLDLVVSAFVNKELPSRTFQQLVTVTLGNPDGTFGEATTVVELPADNSSKFSTLRVADFDDDGQFDILTTDREESMMFFLKGDGQGGFAEAIATTLATNLYNFKSADLDQDGNLDLIGMSNSQQELGYMLGLGDGNFDDFLTVYGDPAGPLIPLGEERNYAVTDMDGDGDIDIVVSDYRERNITVMSNDGAMGFSVSATLDSIYPFYPFAPQGPPTPAFAVFVGDFNGDSRSDIAYGTLEGSSNRRGGLGVYLGDGSGTSFVYQDGADAIAKFPNNAAGNGDPVDIDNDGDLDIVIASSRGGRSSDGQMPSVLINRGDGTFTTTNLTAPAFSKAPYESINNESNAKGVLVGDYNQDGLLDISTYRSHYGGSFASVTVVLADQPGVFASSSSLLFENITNGPKEFFEAGDFNNDGIVDLWSPGYQDLSRTWLGKGDGTFEDPFPATPAIGNEGLSQGTVQDFNQDGILDVFWVGFNGVQNGPPARYLAALGNGDGTFEITFREPSGSRRPDWGDFNGDGFLDFAASNTDSVQIYLYDVENPGTWIFDNELTLSDLGAGATGYGFSMTVADFDQDGNSDVGVVAKLIDEPFRLVVYPGLGDGTFDTPVSTFYAEAASDYTSTNWMDTGDFNEDGIPDVVVYENYSISVHLGAGDGTFGRADIYPAWRTSTSEKQLHVRDINHDGHDDVLFTDVQGSQSLGILLGNGDGSFQDRIAYDVPSSAGAIAFGDFDNDGREDVVLNGRSGGNFATILSGARQRLTDIVAADLNGDGNDDVLATYTDSSRVKWFLGDNLGNLNRQPDLFTDFGPVALTVSDLDDDGSTEIITANRSARSISIFSGEVDNWTRTDIDVGQAPIDVLSGLVDDDDIADLLVIDEVENALWVLSGNGDNSFSQPVAVSLGDRPSAFLLANVDSDGSNDVVVSLPDSNRLMILPGDGQGGFGAPQYVVLAGSASAIAAVDFNQDGNIDLAATLGDQDRVAIIYGRGQNQFARPQLIAVGDNPIAMSSEDADDDGRIDLIVTNQGDDTVSVIYNRFDPNEVYRYDADAIDPDNDLLTYSIVDGPGGLIINSETGALLWAASPDQVGEHSVTLSADDGRGGVATQSYKIDVQPARDNATPLLATEPETAIGANEVFTYQATALDGDSDAVRYRIVDGPEGATIDPTTGLLTWDGRDEALLFNEFGQNGQVGVVQSESYKTPNVTIEGWYKIDHLTASNGAALLFEHLSDSGHHTFRVQTAGNKELQLLMRFADFGTFRSRFDFIPETDRWYHIAMTVDDAAQLATLLVDGESIGSYEMPSSLEYGVNRSLTIGGSQTTVDNFRVWSVARTEAEIREGMAEQYDDDPRVTLDYRFNKSGSYSVYDSSIYGSVGYFGASTVVPRPTIGLTDPGKRSFTLSVEDGRGGYDSQSFVLDVLPEQRGRLVGQLFDDLNGDGDQDDGSEDGVPAEPNLEGWHLWIDSNGNAYPDPHEPQATTDADGNYEFAGLLPGSFLVRVSPVAGFVTPAEFEAIVEPEINRELDPGSVTDYDLAIEQLSLSHIRGQLATEDGDAIAYWKAYADLDGDGQRGDDEPMAVSDRNGNYALTGLDAGTYTIRTELPAGWADSAGREGLEVTLAADEIAADNDFILEPTNTSVTGGVHFVTMPGTKVEARDTFTYASIAIGISDAEIVYDLSLAPEGMVIDPNTGLVAWRPTIEQVGEHLVILRATDASGSISLHDFTLGVSAPNTAPVIILPAASADGSQGSSERHLATEPFLDAYVGLNYLHDVIAQDAESTSLSYTLTQSPSGATIDADSGRISWTPAAGDVGSQDFTVEVTDEGGASTSATWSVAVQDSTPVVLPLDVTYPRSTAAVTTEYFSRIMAADAIGRPVTWSTTSGPAGLTIASDGSIEWTPSSDQLGAQSVELTATTADGATETVAFDIEVLGRALNSTPTIDSEPVTSVSLGQNFQYDIAVYDADQDIHAFTLLEGPIGMSVHPSLGFVSWKPAEDQLGEHDVLIQVSDPSGDTAEQSFTLAVSRFGGPPRIVSIPPTEASAGVGFLYSVEAVDREGDPLTYSLLAAPAGMTIVETTGELSWTPTADQVGDQDVVIQVSDGIGGASTQAFVVKVSAGVANLPPSINSSSPRFGAVGTEYSYTLVAIDPEDTSITFTLGRGPVGMTVDASTGLVLWTPADDQVGKHVVTLIAADEGGASAVESFEFDVLAQNTTPVINSTPAVEIAAGALFMYDVLATDADLDQLQYELTDAPAGAAIDPFGRIRWETAVPLIGSHDFTVQVTDPRGGEAMQRFAVEVIEDLIAPKLSAIPVPGDSPVGNSPWGTQFRIFVRAIDNVAIASLTLKANGQDIPLDAAGTAEFTFEQWGFSTITTTATAIDTNGNITTKTNTFGYDVPQGWSGAGGDEVPTALITSPADADAVTGMVSITGTADHEDFALYKLSYRHVDDAGFTEFFESTTPVTGGELGVWDTSLLLNDEYVIRLQVVTNDAVVNVVDVNVGLAGELKLGNFQLSFTDMVIPVAGIPIEITRIYDTLQAGREGDFGYGWRLEYRNTDLRVGLPSSGLEDIGIYSALRPGVKVYLNVPGEGRQGFTFNPDIRVLPGFGDDNLVLARPRFTPDPGVTSTLSTGVSQYLQVNPQGELYAPGGIPYNPASPDFGGAYVLTTRSGITYRVDGATGKLNSSTDRNGNTLRFSEGGVDFNAGLASISIARDREGRIQSITDPNGNSLAYEYRNGQLGSFEDRDGNLTRFVYASDGSNYLSEVIDPLGRTGQRNDYDENGRIVRSFDANGNPIELAFDPESEIFEQTDRSGRVTQVAYDQLGNIVAIADPLGNTARSTFDKESRILSTTDQLGNVTSFRYDQRGRRTEETNASGHTRYYEYNESNQLATQVDALGNRLVAGYDEAGNQTTLTLNGVTQSKQEFDEQGRVTATEDALGNRMEYSFDGIGLISATLQNGETYQFQNDPSGSPVGESATLSGPTGDVSVAWDYELNNSGEVVSVSDGLGHTSTSELDGLGRIVSSTTADGIEQVFNYDDVGTLSSTDLGAGQVVTQTVDPDGRRLSIGYDAGASLTYTYDAAGRQIGINASNGRGSTIVLDAAGRTIQRTFADGTIENYVYDAIGQLVSKTNNEDILLEYEYDAGGDLVSQLLNGRRLASNRIDETTRVETQTYADGLEYRIEYDLLGNPITLEDQNKASTSYEYDSQGLLAAVVTPSGSRWEYLYDGAGHLAVVNRPDGQTVEVKYDQLGRVASRTLPGELTESLTFDSRGNLTEQTDFAGITTAFAFDGQNRITEIRYDNVVVESRQFPSDLQTTIESMAGTTTIDRDNAGRTTSWTDTSENVQNYSWVNNQVEQLSGSAVEREFSYLQNRIQSVQTSETSVALQYDAFLNLESVDFTNDASLVREYDQDGALTRVAYVSSTGAELFELELERAAGSRIVSRTIDGEKTDFGYDLEGRLVFETGEVSRRYSYGGLGNRSELLEGSDRTILQHDSNDRLTSINGNEVEHDPNGRLTRRVTETGEEILAYDHAGQLTRFTRIGADPVDVVYEYDFDGLLVSRTQDAERVEFIWDRYSSRLPMLAAITDSSGGVITEFFSAGTNYLMQRDADGSEIHYVTDQVGSVVAGITGDGSVAFTQRMDSFGNLVDDRPGSWIAFAGAIQDPTTGLLYQRARWYSPELGRFIQPDPAEAAFENPQTINRYVYAGSDPVNHFDFDGYLTFAELTVTQKITVGLVAGLGIASLGAADAPSYIANKFSGNKLTFKNMTGTLSAFAEAGVAFVAGATGGLELVTFDGASSEPSLFAYAGYTIGFEGTAGLSRSSPSEGGASPSVALRPTAVGEVFEATEASHYEGLFRNLSAGVRGGVGAFGVGLTFGSVNSVAWSPSPIPGERDSDDRPVYAHTRVEFRLGGVVGAASGVGLSAVTGYSSTWYFDWTGMFTIEENFEGAILRRANPIGQ